MPSTSTYVLSFPSRPLSSQAGRPGPWRTRPLTPDRSSLCTLQKLVKRKYIELVGKDNEDGSGSDEETPASKKAKKAPDIWQTLKIKLDRVINKKAAESVKSCRVAGESTPEADPTYSHLAVLV